MEAKVIDKPSDFQTHTLRLKRDDSYSKMMYEVFVLSLILTWLPSKAVSYASPYIILMYTFIVYKHYTILLNFIKIIALVVIFIGINYLIRNNYIFSNGILTIITYGSFLLLWALPNRNLSPTYLKKVYKAIYFTVAFQSVFGILQFMIAYAKFGSYTVDMGDFIQGTIVPMSFNIEGDRGIGNAYFVINILIMLLFSLTDARKTKTSYLIIILGSAAVVLAGVHHALISLFLGLFVALYIAEFKRAVRLTFILIPAIVIVLAVFYFLNPNNVYLYSHYFNLYSTGESFKTLAMKSALIDLYQDHPDISVFGTGLGQFSSRAGLIASGTYLGGLDENRSIPFFPIAKSFYFKNYAFDVYYSMKMDKSTVHGAASRTFFSLMSIYVELGMAAFIGILIYLGAILKKLKNRYKLYNQIGFTQAKNIITVLMAAILFFVFISFFENYLEMSQATLTCFILIKLFYNTTFQPVQKLMSQEPSHKLR